MTVPVDMHNEEELESYTNALWLAKILLGFEIKSLRRFVLFDVMLRLSDAQYHAALSGHHCPSVLRSSQPPTRKSRPATTTRSL
jgi:hypothetical protein